MFPFPRKAFALSLLVVLLQGCETLDGWLPESAPEEQKKAVFPFVQLAPTPPPPVQFEPRPVLPALGQTFWRPGHWSYNGTDFVWHDGAMMERPAPTARWMPDRWERRQYGWAFVPGFWF